MEEVYRNEYGSEFRFNDPVEAWMTFLPLQESIGRLIQVRKNKGQFGSDVYFIRKPNGQLQTFENVCLRPYAGELPPVNEADSVEIEYTIRHEYPEVGFLIAESAQPQSPSPSFAIRITKEN